ncbi:DUF1176 domain-containing protein [Burkholderia pseudomallei]|uniref:DUF1176 domain-containing protein n=1 Tax=Burkholderia pseudomallei TaxID=28450 RepID=UPI000F07FBC1|nr:DUF1176 domain-containing protein [Burkholderia pseudomallei]CAJ3719291.1 Protein of uncharacterised function (DUF1176) [Burkholderia pseudomallei]VBR77809.1 Protein of uncharacterised function (DUF1176) [Burkholderia pseudomallei]
MTLSRGFLTGLAWMLCAVSSTMAAAGPKSDPSYVRDFKGWEVVCDNVKRCVAEGADDTDPSLIVWLWRDAGPDGVMKLQVAADKPFSADQMRFDGHPFRIDPSKSKAWRDENVQTYPYRLVVEDASVVTTWVEAARDAGMMSFGDPAAPGAPRISLAGLSAALLAIDDVQGRVGTVTAWRDPGPAAASSVPAAKPLPIIGPAKPTPDLSKAEQRRLVSATLTRFQADVARCDAGLDEPDDKQAPRRESKAVALSTSEALVSLGCGDSTAYNDTSLWYRVRRQPPFSAKPLDLGENTGAGDEGDNPPLRNELTGAGYDSSRGELESFQKVRSAGDCGASTTWIFDGAKFVLAEKRFQGACSGLFMDDWPWLYRAKTR